MRKQRCDGMATRAAILDAAADEFCEKGYGLGSARAVCVRAGVNTALANRYFGTKEDLYRATAKRLFGDLGTPLASLSTTVTDEGSWKAAVREWVADLLYMALPTKKEQKRCAALFRHEVTHPTKFRDEFRETFGKPVYDGLRKLLAMAVEDETELDLWMSSVWAQACVYALADKSWHASFRPRGVHDREWADKVCDFICDGLFRQLRFRSV